MRTMSCTLLLIAAALLSAPAWADPPEAPAPEVRFKTRTVLDFGSVTLQGQVTRPEGTLIMGHRRARFKTLIRVRGGFTPELLRSAERL